MKIFIFTGLSASGKSTISRSVSDKLKLPRVDLHTIIHNLATQEGFLRTRDWIANKGVAQALTESRERLLQEVEGVRNERGVIVDEVLDAKTLESLRDHFPEDEISIVFLRTNRHQKRKFMRKRLGIDEVKTAEGEIQFIDRMKNLAGIKEIIDQASYRFCNSASVEGVSSQIANELEKDISPQEGAFCQIKKEREF